MAVLSAADRDKLSDDQFGYVEPGHAVNGKTPGKYRHFPIHDAKHVRNALSRGAQGARFWDKAKGKVMSAAKKLGIDHDSGSETGRSLESLYPEMRFLFDQPEIRMVGEEGAQSPHIFGHAAMFEKLSRRLGGFQEVVDKRAFDDAQAHNFPGVVCRYNHRDDMVLGTTAAGTLTLEIDERGLRYDVNPPRTRGDVTELVMRGDVRYSSFAFRCAEPGVDDQWSVTEYNYPLRRLNKVELVDVAPVLDPAYFDTSSAARSMTGAVESLARWVDGDPDEVRSLMAAGQAMKFFKRSDRTSAIPQVSKEAAEARVMDDQAVALRNWKYDEDVATEAELDEAGEAAETEEAPEEQNSAPEVTDAEVRAKLQASDALCRKYTDGEPCVRPTGHKGDCAGPCWARKDGLPCCKPQGHMTTEGDAAEHEPMHIMSRDGSEAEAPEETREAETEAPKTLNAREVALKMSAMRARMMEIDIED